MRDGPTAVPSRTAARLALESRWMNLLIVRALLGEAEAVGGADCFRFYGIAPRAVHDSAAILQASTSEVAGFAAAAFIDHVDDLSPAKHPALVPAKRRMQQHALAWRAGRQIVQPLFIWPVLFLIDAQPLRQSCAARVGNRQASIPTSSRKAASRKSLRVKCRSGGQALFDPEFRPVRRHASANGGWTGRRRCWLRLLRLHGGSVRAVNGC